MASVRNTVDFNKARQPVRDKLYSALYVGADMIRAEAARSITAGSVSGKNHVVSVPGAPPNADTRQLDTGIVVKGDKQAMRVSVVSQAPYSADLEYGTYKMAARPFMRRAAFMMKRQVTDLVNRALASLKGKP